MPQLAASYEVPSIMLILNDGFSLSLEVSAEMKSNCVNLDE